jgi:DNA replication and repair protein RecF
VYLARLALTDFRCYESADITFEPGVTTFTGPNGAGKRTWSSRPYYIATFEAIAFPGRSPDQVGH